MQNWNLALIGLVFFAIAAGGIIILRIGGRRR
jgi:hypothetical protein